MKLSIKLVLPTFLLLAWINLATPNALAQSSGGTGDILVENWTNSFLYGSKWQTTKLYDEFDSAPSGEVKLWTRSLSIDGCFTQSKIIDGTCAQKDWNSTDPYYGPLLNNTGVGIDVITHENRKVARYWIQQDTGHSHGARLNLKYDFLSPYSNRRIYARYYMKFPKLLPVVQSGGSWTSIGVEMKAHGWNTSATIQNNYDRNHKFWMASPFVSTSFTPFLFEANKWYRMDVVWDMFYDGTKGRWSSYIDGVKLGEGIGQMATSSGYGLWIFNLYGDMFANQVRGEMYLGDVILSTQPIGSDTFSTPTPSPVPTPTPTPIPVNNEGFSKLPVSSVTASSFQTGNGPENTIDNNLSTRWSTCGIGETITYDLGSSKTVAHVNIAFYLATTQISKFDIQVSNDNTTWTTVYTGQSSTNTFGVQKFDFNNLSGRYVRIVGNGNLTADASCWNSYTEVEIYGTGTSISTNSPTPTVVPTAVPSATSQPTSSPLGSVAATSYYGTFDSATAVTTPLVGTGGRLSGATLTTGKVGNGVSATGAGQHVAIPSSGNFDKTRGTVEFWLKPNWSHTDGLAHPIFSDSTGAIHLIKEANNNLRFYVAQGTTYPDVKISSDNYALASGNWYKIRLQWNDQAAKADQLKVWINDNEPVHTDGVDDLDSTKYSFGTDMVFGSAGSNNTNAVIDELRVSFGATTWKVGDSNEDGFVDGKDYVRWINNYGKLVSTRHYGGDYNLDGVADGKDYVSWINNYGK